MKKLLLTLSVLLITAHSAYADGDNKRMKSAKIDRDQAKSIALKEVPGTVVDADFERRKGVTMWIVDIKPTEGKSKKEVRVDATTGAVISVKEDDDD
jgi:uncharacterized membrane protein YkoI